MPSDLRRDLVSLLREALPEWSEFRQSDRQDQDPDPRIARRGRRVTIPLTIDSADPFSGSLFSQPDVQPAPTLLLRLDDLPEEIPIVLYLSWDLSPRQTPGRPLVYALVRWGVGGAVFSRMVDVHRVPRRMALCCNFVEVLGVYLDVGSPIGPALPAVSVPSVDAICAAAVGDADPNYWTGTWLPPERGIPPVPHCNMPAAILAMSGSILSLPVGVAGAYVMLVDCATPPGPVSGASVPIPGSVSPLLPAGSGYAFDEDEVPGVFADQGVSAVLSTTPNLYVAVAGSGLVLFSQVKVAS